MKPQRQHNSLAGTEHAAPRIGKLSSRHGTYIAIWLFLLVTATNAQGQVKTPSTIIVIFPNYSYAETVASVHELDLKNSDAIIFGNKEFPDFHARLSRGSYEKRTRTDIDDVKLEWVKVINGESIESDYAVGYYIWSSIAVSSDATGVVQLLKIEAGHRKVVQQFLFNMRGSEKAGAYFNVKTNALIIRALNDWEHCCPNGLDVVRFELKEPVFKPVRYSKAPLQ